MGRYHSTDSFQHAYSYLRIKSEARRNIMRQKKHEAVSGEPRHAAGRLRHAASEPERSAIKLRHRTVSLLLTLAVVITAISFCFATTVSAESGKYYFDISKNTSWAPGSGEKLMATFTSSGSGGSQVGSNVELTPEGTNLYSFTAPSGAANVQLYLLRSGYTMPTTAPANGYTRVFFDNTKANWNNPKVYAWTNGNEMKFSDSPYMTHLSGKWYYYDTTLKNVIFHNGSGQQTGDLAISGKNLVFSKYAGNSGWDSLPYYKKFAETELSSTGDALYAMPNGDVQFSKYMYSSSDPRPYTPKQVYFYNPSLTSADTVSVKWDLSDPYNDYSENMTYDSSVGYGFFKAKVPPGAKVEFSYGSTTLQAVVPTEDAQDCYIAGSKKWVNHNDAVNEKTDFTAPIESRSNHDTGSAFWVDAVYYDYLSDKEYDSGWLNPIQAGTGFNSSSNDWFEFKNFNSKINSLASADSSIWRFPLYFGNLCGTFDAYDGNQARDDNRPSSHAGYMGPNITGLTNFDYVANDSNGLWANGQDSLSVKKPDYNYSVRGLAYDSLDANGNIQYADGCTMPYFDSEWIQSNGVGKSVKSSFPFRQTPKGGDVTLYSFNSEDGLDNVFFNWNGKNPQSVGYGKGGDYAVEDGIKYFMHNENSGKGIFPFNNTSYTRGSKTVNLNSEGKENINYGFGVKMDMDFRVPKDGKLPDGSSVTFHYSGDDDLWVYISEYDDNGDLTNSQLVLDLGGDHKKAVGDIDFSRMTATAEKSVLPSVNSSYKRNSVYIVDSYNWGSIWVWAWNGSEGHWFQAQWDSYANCYRVDGDQTSDGKRFDSMTMFKCAKDTSWSAQTDKQDTIVSHLGRKTYTNNLHYAEDCAVNYDYKGNVDNSGRYTKNWGFASDGYGTLDPSKTYHMTVFYMERGMLESNCEIEFTMTPAQNDVIVEKTINTSDFNPGLAGEIPSQEFSFNNSENGKSDKAVAYTKYDYDIKNGSTDSHNITMSDSDNGTYFLGHNDSADFNFQYETGSTIKVTEQYPDSGIEYGGTKYTVTDEKGNTIISKTDAIIDPTYGGASTSDFKLINKKANGQEDKYSNVTRIVSFENTPKVAPLTIGKAFVDENGAAVTDSGSFGFRLQLSLSDDNPPRGYRFAYVVNGEELYTNEDGEFWFSSEDTVTIKGLPVGAYFVLQELPTSGYIPYEADLNGSKQTNYGGSYNDTIEGVIGDANSFTIINQQKPVKTSLEARKYLAPKGKAESLYTNGNLFEFEVQGLGETPYKVDPETNTIIKSKDASGMSKTVSQTDANGKVVFENEGGEDTFLKFNEAGGYIFEMTEIEEMPNLGLDDYFLNDDISYETNKYLAVVEVKDDGSGALAIDSVSYYYWDGGAVGVNSFSNPIETDIPEFKNPVMPGKVTVVKTDNNNEPLNGVVFSLYKVDNDLEDARRKELVLDDSELFKTAEHPEGFLENAVFVSDAETNGTDAETGKDLGIAEFGNLDIYKRDSSNKLVYTTVTVESGIADDPAVTYTVPEYQTYALLEKTTVDGHAKSKVVGIFKLPVVGDGGQPQYNITYSYVNGKLKAPETAGFGTSMWRIFGITAITLSVIMLLAYVLYFKKRGYTFVSRRK